MLQSRRYPDPSGREWERNSEVSPFAVFGDHDEGMLQLVPVVVLVFFIFHFSVWLSRIDVLVVLWFDFLVSCVPLLDRSVSLFGTPCVGL